MLVASPLRTVVTPSVIFRLLLGWGAFAALLAARPTLAGPLRTPTLFGLLAVIVTVIVVCAFGVVTQAEHLARRLGDPYGTLILTLSIVMIEVILISAVMLGPGEHATIARDSVMAVSMIILNLVVGVALLVGGLRHASLQPNRTGVSAYLTLLIVLSTVAFALPGLIGLDGSYLPGQAVPIIVMTIVLYALFLFLQMGPQRTDFQEVPVPATVLPTTAGAAAAGPTMAGSPDAAFTALDHSGMPGSPGSRAPMIARPAPRTGVLEILVRHRAEVLARTVVLILTVVPIVLLSHDMAALLDDGLDRVGAPVALSGILIAMIVFLPETITTVRAAFTGEIQRVSNLCHGALVSTVGLTIPAVLTIGMLTGQTVTLAESPANLVLLGITLLLSITTFTGKRVTALHGAAHLMIFMLYGMSVFA